jgi:putative oxidoreductase
MWKQINNLQNNFIGQTYIKFTNFLDTFGSALFMLFIRIWMAQIFWYSGLTKISNWPATIYLFQYEYKVPELPVEFAAISATTIELVCPVLITIGFMTRLSAIPMLIMAIVIETTFLKLTEQIYWMILLGMIIIQGPGKLSLDYWIKRKLAKK